MKKKIEEKFVLEKTFKQFAETVAIKFDAIGAHFVGIEDKLANMATKDDINRILDRMDFYAGKYRGIDQEQAAQALHIKELRSTAQNHETRLSSLESHP